MIVYGVPIEDPTVAEQVKRVMNVAAICFAMGLMGQLGGAVNGTGQLFGIFAVSLVPACGYYGAKGKNRGLLGCFWCCNGCTFFFGIVMVGFGVWFVTSNAFLFSIMGDLTHCCGELDDKSGAPGRKQPPSPARATIFTLTKATFPMSLILREM